LNTGLLSDVIESCDPRAHIAKALLWRHNKDNPTMYQALNGPHADEYVSVMREGVATLLNQETWEEVLRPTIK
jgi:hypothetical protein